MSLVSATVSASWASPGLCDLSFWRCILKQLVPAGEGIRQKFNRVGQRGAAKAPHSCKNMLRHTRSRWDEQETLNGGSRWLHTLTAIYQNPVYFGWQDRAAEESTSQERWMWRAPQLWEKAGSCGQRRFLEIWRGIGVTLRWQSGMERLSGEKIIPWSREMLFLSMLRGKLGLKSVF